MVQNLFGYAGDGDDPRPLPKRTLGSVKRKLADYFQADSVRPEMRAPQAVQLAFCSDRVSAPPEDAIPVPREHLWWLAAPNDLLLLSDRITHHYTTVERVAGEGDRIYFLDDWPDRIFLQEGLNSAGVSARVEPYFAGILDEVLPGRLQVSVTRPEFLRVVVGLITQDTPALLERYVEAFPAAVESFSFNLAAGLGLLDASEDRLAADAVPYLARAVALAQSRSETADEERASAALYVALQAALQRGRERGDPLAWKPYADAVRDLTARRGDAALLELLDIEQLCRLGNAAGWGQDLDAAAGYLDRALARDGGHEGARWLRAKVRFRAGDFAGALEDGTEALAANLRRTQEREAERNARDPRDRWGRIDDDGRIAGLIRRRGDEHGNRATALIQLGRSAEARADAEAAIRCVPSDPTGYRLLAIIDHLAGDVAAAKRNIGLAMERETGERERAHLAALLQSINPVPSPT
jgi:tetratricopeptide (TPR) repeat protein